MNSTIPSTLEMGRQGFPYRGNGLYLGAMNWAQSGGEKPWAEAVASESMGSTRGFSDYEREGQAISLSVEGPVRAPLNPANGMPTEDPASA